MVLHQTVNSQGNYHYNAFIYRDIFWPPHFHSSYELIYTIEGVTDVTVNGEPDVLSAGEMLLVPPYGIHSLSVRSGARTWVGVFSDDYIPEFSAKQKYTRYTRFRCGGDVERFLLEHLFFQGKPELYTAIACLHLVCGACLQNAVPSGAPPNSAFMSRLIRYISDHLSEDISLQTAADALGYEYHYFSSLFHQCFAINFKSFLHTFRFLQATQLLADPGRDITSVSRECGFGSIRNFNRVFKLLSGCTPSQYRKNFP